MFVYADPECSFFLPVKFQAAPVNRNDIELICNCFIKVRNTTLSRRNRIYNIHGITWQKQKRIITRFRGNITVLWFVPLKKLKM